MAWSEANGVGYLLGTAQNSRPVATITDEPNQARQRFEATSRPARIFAESRDQNLDTSNRGRGVAAKAERLAKGLDPAVRGHVSAGRRPAGTAAV